MSNMCILINSLASGGGEKVALTLCEDYKRKGINITFVCLEKNDFYELNHPVYYLSDLTGLNEKAVMKFLSLFLFALRLKRLIKKENISVVQSHLYRANYVNVLAKYLGSTHKAQLVNHGIVSRYKDENFSGLINLWLIKRLYSKADQLIFPSKGMMHDLNNLGEFNNAMQVINNPFDVNEILKLKDEPVIADEFVFDPNKKYLVAVGRLEKVKRFQDIIKAVDKLKQDGFDLDFLILGDGPETSNLQLLINYLNLQESVHLFGRVANPFKYISRSDILISASEYEGFSNVIVEAFISGTAVISSDCESGPREILAPDTDVRIKLKHGEIEFAQFGVLVPVNDYETLAKAVKNLLEDQNRLESYSTNGICRARDFDKAVIFQKYIESLKALPGKK
ncbi:MAG: glycosyltransferase [Desulfobacteraceae bacterium]|jgi:glycosyltransferase involved in cell wall biosynthesis|nr:glycosyltransferase [Desulfobacteraceae bacterium]